MTMNDIESTEETTVRTSHLKNKTEIAEESENPTTENLTLYQRNVMNIISRLKFDNNLNWLAELETTIIFVVSQGHRIRLR